MREMMDQEEAEMESVGDFVGIAPEEMLRILRLILRVESLDTLLERIASTISTNFGIRALTICVLDEETGYFRPKVVRGFPEDQTRAISNHAYTLERKRDELDEKFRIEHNCYYVRAEGLTHVYNDDVDYIQDLSDLRRPRESVEEWHDLDYIDFIMTDRIGNWIGWIEIDEPVDKKAPSRRTIEKIHVLSELAAIAIENSKIFDDAIDAVGQSQKYLELIVRDLGNIVSPLIDALDEASDDSSNEEAMRKAKAMASEAKNLIDNVRRISEVMLGDSLPRREHDLREVMVKCISLVKRDFPVKDIIVGMDCPYEDCKVAADEFIVALFSNLLGNAVKHTPGDTAEVDISIVNGHSAWIVKIEDHGRGIPEERKARLFSGEARASDHRKASGLGLSIVKLLVERYKGIITVRDRVSGAPSEGTCFEVALPKADKV